MAKTNNRPGRFSRFTGWFGRHKVTAVFAALVTVLALYLAGSWVVLQAQIHFEREQFLGVNREIYNDTSRAPSGGERKVNNFCSYRGQTGFGRHWLSCTTGALIVYKNLSSQQALSLTNDFSATLSKNIKLHDEKIDSNFNELSSYSFTLNKLSCFYDSQFYNEGSEVLSRPDGISLRDSALYLSMNCNGDVKSAYFHTVHAG